MASLDEIGVSIVGKFNELTAAFTGAAESAESSMAEIGQSVTAAVESVDAKMAEAGESLNGFRDTFSHVAEVIAAGFAVDKLVDLVKTTAEAAENFKLLSETTGISTDKLQGLKYAAEQVNIDWGMMSKGLEVLNHNMLSARESTDDTSVQMQTFAMVGLDRVALSTMNTDQALTVIANKFQSIHDPSQKAGVAMALFGRAGASLVPLLDQGASGIEKLEEKAKSLGIVMGSDALNSATAFADQLKDMKAAEQGVEQELAIKLLPLFSQVTGQLEDGAKAAQKDGGAIDVLKNAITGIVIALEALWSAIQLIIDAGRTMVTTLVDGFSGVGTVLDDVVHGHFKQAVTDMRATSHAMFEDMKSGLDDLASHFSNTWRHIAAMAAGESAKATESVEANAGGAAGDGGGFGTAGGPTKKETKIKFVADPKTVPAPKIDIATTASALKEAEKEWNDTEKRIYKGYDQMVKDMDKALMPITKAFDQTITGVVRGTETWHQGMRKMVGSVEEEFLGATFHMAQHWAAMELAKTAASLQGDQIRTTSAEWSADKATLASVGGAIKTIGAKAWQAAASVYADVSEIPFVGWILAPIMAVAAAVEVAGFIGRIASAAGGWDRVPHDQLAMVHQNEMVLPAQIAEGARRTFGKGGRGGDHFHINALDARSFSDALRRNPQAFAKGLRHARTMGAL